MHLFWLSAVLVVASNVAYHISQKSIPSNANVLISNIVTFFAAILVSAIFLVFIPPGENIVSASKKVGWASVGRGLTIVGIEIGYLLLYRSGWNISLGSVFCNTAVFLLLIPVGLVLYKERLSVANYAGMILAVAAIYLLSRK